MVKASLAPLCRAAVPRSPSISELSSHHQDGRDSRGPTRSARPSRTSSDQPCMNLRRRPRRSQKKCDVSSLPVRVHVCLVAERFEFCRSACPWMVLPPTLQSARLHHCCLISAYPDRLMDADYQQRCYVTTNFVAKQGQISDQQDPEPVGVCSTHGDGMGS